MRIWVAAVIGLALTAPAAPQIRGELKCKLWPYNAARIEEITAIFKGLDQIVELVPPSDAGYIDAEAAAALAQSNSARFNTVAASRWYPAHKFHKDMRIALSFLEQAAKAPDVRAQALALSDVVSAMFAVSTSLDDYLRSPWAEKAGMNDKLLPWFKFTTARLRAQRAMECIVSGL
jgi:hypothetical protein